MPESTEDPSVEMDFETVCEKVLKGQEKGLANSLVVRCLWQLLRSPHPDARLVECFAHSVLWRSRRMEVHNLCACLAAHVKHQTGSNELQRKVMERLQGAIRERLSEAKSMSDLIWLLDTAEYMGGDNRRFVLEVQDRALQLVGSLSHADLRLLVRTLARLRLRPTPLLQAATFYLSKGHGGASLKEIVSLLHSLHSLSFPEPAVLQQLSEAFVEQLTDDTKVSLVAACLTGVGQLSWRHPELLETCASWLVAHRSSCRPADLTACVLALARLQYVPECADELFPVLLEELREDRFADTPAVWLDVVWSLALLGRVQQSQLDSVLQPHFYQPLLGESSVVASCFCHNQSSS